MSAALRNGITASARPRVAQLGSAPAPAVTLPLTELEALVERAAERGAERAYARLQSGPIIALPTMKAAQALGVSHDTFKNTIAPELPVIRRNSKPLYPVADLQRWADENAEKTL